MLKPFSTIKKQYCYSPTVGSIFMFELTIQGCITSINLLYTKLQVSHEGRNSKKEKYCNVKNQGTNNMGLDLVHWQKTLIWNVQEIHSGMIKHLGKNILITADRIYSPQCKHLHQEDGYTQACVRNEDVKGSYADLLLQAGHQ